MLEQTVDLLSCRICEKKLRDRMNLIEHLQVEHDSLEIASYAANTMVQDEERDKTAREFHRRFDHLKRELAGL